MISRLTQTLKSSIVNRQSSIGRRLGLGLAIVIAAVTLIILLLRWLFPPQLTLLEQGRQLYYGGHYTAAIPKLRQYVLNHSQDTESRILIAQNFIALRQWQPAQGYLRELLLAQGETPAALYWMATAQAGDKKYDLAEKNWRSLINTNNPTYKVRARLGLAELYYQQSNFSGAAGLLYEALSLAGSFDPLEEQRANYLYGVLLTRDMRFQDAANQFKRALKIKAGSFWLENAPVQWRMAQTNDRINLILARLPEKTDERSEAVNRARAAYALIAIEEYGPAEENLNRVIELVSTWGDIRAYQGLIYWRTGRNPQARTTLLTVLKQEPNNRLARQFTAQFLIDQLQNVQPENTTLEQFELDAATAQKLLADLLKESPGDVLLTLDMARLFVARHDYQQAEAYYLQADKLWQNSPVGGLNPEAQLTRMFAEMGVDPCRRGQTMAERVTKNSPGDAESWFAAGFTQLACIQPDKAIQYFQKALELRPYWPDAVYRLGQAYLQKDNKLEAEKWLNMAADIEPAQRWAK